MRTRVRLCPFLASVLPLCLPAILSAQIIKGPIINSANGHDYYIISEGNWSQDEADAESIGGHLATVRNAAENTWILNNLAVDFSASGGPNLSDVPLWIGFYDPTGIAHNDGFGGPGTQHAADFVWADGEPVTYTNWTPLSSNGGEPNNAGGIEYYTAFNWPYVFNTGAPGTWNDTPIGGFGDGPYYGVAEVDVPEPASAALVICTILATVKARGRINKSPGTK
jgi:hypothetical protein